MLAVDILDPQTLNHSHKSNNLVTSPSSFWLRTLCTWQYIQQNGIEQEIISFLETKISRLTFTSNFLTCSTDFNSDSITFWNVETVTFRTRGPGVGSPRRSPGCKTPRIHPASRCPKSSSKQTYQNVGLGHLYVIYKYHKIRCVECVNIYCMSPFFQLPNHRKKCLPWPQLELMRSNVTILQDLWQMLGMQASVPSGKPI